MAYLGLLTLGAFIGTILLGSLQFANDLKTFQKIATYVISSALTGSVMTLVNKLAGQQGVQNIANAVFMYPIGLFMALLFYYLPGSLRVLGAKKDEHAEVSVQLAWCHIGILTIATI